jgi:peptidoglycan/xylan/chitin deacetylase (PgdA/CDA1 family)
MRNRIVDVGRVGVVALFVTSAACSGSTHRGPVGAAATVFASTTTTSETVSPRTEPNVPSPPRPVHEIVPPGPRARVVFSIRTREPVVFVTIDDGFFRDPRVIAFIAEHRWPITAFLIDRVAKAAPSYFRLLGAAGATIEDHTYSHPDLPTLSFADQQQQICRPTRDFPGLLSVRPTLFRPPYGSYDDATRRAAETCGFSTLIEWTATLTKGVLRVAVRRPLHGGDIILLHFVPSLYNDLQFLAVQLAASHLRVARLETYVT